MSRVFRRVIVAVGMVAIGAALGVPSSAFAAAPSAGASSSGTVAVKPGALERAAQQRAAARGAPQAAKPAAMPGLAQPLVATQCGNRPPAGTPPGGAPFETWSRYVAATDLFQMGFNQGCTSDQQRGSSSSLYQIVILDFGDPGIGGNGSFGAWDRGGFHSIGSTSQTNSIEWSLARYMLGFWDGTVAGSGSFMTVMVGTNNHKYNADGSDNGAPVNYAHGRAWGLMVNDLNGYIRNSGFTSQLAAQAANDMETSWAYYSQTLDWANGFASVTGAAYYDFGDAGGCPAYGAGECVAGPRNGGHMGWSTANEHTISWGLAPAFAVPEIFIPIQAQQWYRISLSGSRIYFTAAMSQHDACGCENTYDQSWSQMQNAVNSDSRTYIGRIPYTTEVSYSTA
jgi:hypothetical protein